MNLSEDERTNIAELAIDIIPFPNSPAQECAESNKSTIPAANVPSSPSQLLETFYKNYPTLPEQCCTKCIEAVPSWLQNTLQGPTAHPQNNQD